jgi:mannose-6-phosphate isomerase-like protein (cupin superfamily)
MCHFGHLPAERGNLAWQANGLSRASTSVPSSSRLSGPGSRFVLDRAQELVALVIGGLWHADRMSIYVVRPGEGEDAGVGPIGLRIVEDGSHTNHRLGLVQSSLPPGPAQPPQHIHHEHEETFIVTKGKVRFMSGTDSVDADAGTVVVVPIGVPHTFSNPFDEPAAFVGLMTPDLYIQYFRDLGQLPLDAQGLLQRADIARTMARYATEVVPPPQ